MDKLNDRLDAIAPCNGFAALSNAFYSRVPTRAVSSPTLVHVNPEVGALIGLSPTALASEAFLDVVSGRMPWPGGDTLAAVYSGHQFGVWAGQLGDGRAHLLAEVAGPQGSWEIQLKGAGMTPYSRMGDGRAVLRSSIREYLASEAMHGLGIPTTRALALVSSPDPVVRETVETAAVVTRLAPSFVRFGSFEHWAAARDTERLRELLVYVATRYYPEQCVHVSGDLDVVQTTLSVFAEITARTATLMADWQSVGFCHGVMNTDNMSILGLTLDYGPYGFMDAFNMGHICNHTDTQGRYAWNRQPSVGLWNLYRLAGAFHPLLPDADGLRAVLETYEGQFTRDFHAKMGRKIGLDDFGGEEDEALLESLLQQMHSDRADFTLTFRSLSEAATGNPAGFKDLFIDRVTAEAWLARLTARQKRSGRPAVETAQQLNAVNPLYVLRNHLAEGAIKAAQMGDFQELDTLFNLLRSPFQAVSGAERYAALPPDWAHDIEVSCSS